MAEQAYEASGTCVGGDCCWRDPDPNCPFHNDLEDRLFECPRCGRQVGQTKHRTVRRHDSPYSQRPCPGAGEAAPAANAAPAHADERSRLGEPLGPRCPSCGTCTPHAVNLMTEESTCQEVLQILRDLKRLDARRLLSEAEAINARMIRLRARQGLAENGARDD